MENPEQNQTQKITKDLTLSQVLELNPNTRGVLMSFGMFCVGCPLSGIETLEQASQAYGIELDYLLNKLNEVEEFDEKEYFDSISEQPTKLRPSSNFGKGFSLDSFLFDDKD